MSCSAAGALLRAEMDPREYAGNTVAWAISAGAKFLVLKIISID